MKRYKQFKPVVFSDFDTEHWDHPLHNHNHYELIYIQQGNGEHELNGNAFPYEAGMLYLLGPQDSHLFRVKMKTRFRYLKFTHEAVAFIGINDKLIRYPIDKQVVLSDADRDIVEAIFNLLAMIFTRKGSERMPLYQLNGLLDIWESYQRVNGTESDHQPPGKLEDLLAYIHANVQQPKRLRLSELSNVIHSTAGYVGKFFRREMGYSLRDYIRQYRRSLVEAQVSAHAKSKKEVAMTFGFTDVSHLNKFLKGS